MSNIVANSRDELVLRELLDATAAAMRAGDADALAARYAEGAVCFTLAPPLISVDASDPDALRAWFATFDGPVDYEIRDAEVTVGDDVAFCHSINRMSMTPRGGDQRYDLWYRSTVCLRKDGGTWRVVHEHQSVPFYMDGTLRAAVDLKPEGVA